MEAKWWKKDLIVNNGYFKFFSKKGGLKMRLEIKKSEKETAVVQFDQIGFCHPGFSLLRFPPSLSCVPYPAPYPVPYPLLLILLLILQLHNLGEKEGKKCPLATTTAPLLLLLRRNIHGGLVLLDTG